jgi:hypothetical protein
MSSKRYDCYSYDYEGCNFNRRQNNCGCTLNNLAILILIILQFGDSDKEKGRKSHQLIDNSILFIIALYFLTCCNCFR